MPNDNTKPDSTPIGTTTPASIPQNDTGISSVSNSPVQSPPQPTIPEENTTFPNPQAMPPTPPTPTGDTSILNPSQPNSGGGPTTPPANDSSDNVVTSTHVPQKYGGKKIIATIFSVLFITGAVVAGVVLVQRQQLLQKQAEEEHKIEICHVPPGNPENAHKIEVDKSAWEAGHDPHNAHSLDFEIDDEDDDGEDDNDGNRRCPPVTPTPAPTSTPTPVTTSTPTPTGTANNPISCPAGTQPLFTKSGDLKVGDAVTFGTISSLEGDWDGESQNGVLLASGGRKITVNFSGSTYLDSALIYDNDPKTGESPWSINGKSLPTTLNNQWGPLFKLDLTSNQMSFDNGGDSPHFNVCLKQTTATNTPTPPSQLSAQCNGVKAYDLDGNLLTQSQLAQLKAGDKVRFAVSGTASSGTFDKARFAVNNVSIGETTTKNASDEFYKDYEIPQGTTSVSVKGEVNHSSLGWI